MFRRVLRTMFIFFCGRYLCDARDYILLQLFWRTDVSVFLLERFQMGWVVETYLEDDYRWLDKGD